MIFTPLDRAHAALAQLSQDAIMSGEFGHGLSARLFWIVLRFGGMQADVSTRHVSVQRIVSPASCSDA